MKKLVEQLYQRWDRDDATVLADWCEEHEMTSAAKTLREASESEEAYWDAYFRVEELARLMGICKFIDSDLLW